MSTARSSGGARKCFACSRSGHFAKSVQCPAREKNCRKCGKKGHFAVCCKSKTAHRVAIEPEDATPSFSIAALGTAEDTDKYPPIMVDVSICGVPCEMELGTGAEISIFPSSVWFQKICMPLHKSSVLLYLYGGQALHIVGGRC